MQCFNILKKFERTFGRTDFKLSEKTIGKDTVWRQIKIAEIGPKDVAATDGEGLLRKEKEFTFG